MKRSIFVLCALSFLVQANACTDILLKAKDNSVIVGRTFDLEIDGKAQLKIFHKGSEQSSIAPDGTPSIHWKNIYSYLGITAFSDHKLIPQAINEKGLAIEILWLQDTKFAAPSKDQYKNSIMATDIVAWLMGTTDNVTDAKEKLEHITLWAPKIPQFGNIQPPVHFVMHDRTGKSIVVEFIDGKMRTYDSVGVVTNSPPYDWQVQNLRNYVSLTNDATPTKEMNGKLYISTGNGNGLLGMPGNYTPPARFVRAFTISSLANKPENSYDAIILASHILNAVDVTKGVANIRGDVTRGAANISLDKNVVAQDHTQWSTINDLTNMKLYIKNYNSLDYVIIDLNKLWNIKDSKVVAFSELNDKSTPKDVTNMF